MSIIATERPSFVIALIGSHPLVGDALPKRLLRFGQNLSKLLPTHDVSFSVPRVTVAGHSLNMLIDEFRLGYGNEWLFFWDEKVPITPEQVVKLVETRVGVVGALYSDQEELAQWKASFYPDLPALPNELLMVPELEMGAKLYHRSVFDLLEKSRGDLAYIFDQSGRSLFGFCQERVMPVVDYHRLMSPSQFLDHLCREAKVMIYAHVGVIINRAKKEPYRSWEHPRKPAPVCAEELPAVAKDPRPIEVMLQYCDKDKAQAERLERHLLSLGITPVMIYSAGSQYPKGPNETARKCFYAQMLGAEVKAVLLIEPDCVPVTKDWLEHLSDSWDRAYSAGKLIMGSWHPINVDHPTLGHINGNLMFSPELARKITIPDVPPNIPWDTYLADVFEPYWCRTGLIKNLNRHRTASTKQLTTPECGNRPPVLIHGVRDESAWNLAKHNLSL